MSYPAPIFCILRFLCPNSIHPQRQSIEDIVSQVPDAKVEYLRLDLSSLESIKEAVDEFLSKESELHILLNNAGVMAYPPQQTKDGFDIQWGTNHMGHALLVKLLLPTLLSTAASEPPDTVRIVNVASEGHRASRGIKFEDTAQANGNKWLRYGQSKLANILHARALAKHYGDQGVVALACHPGTIYTDLYTPFTEAMGVFGKLLSYPLKTFMTSVTVGSYNQIALCTSPKITVKDGGLYFLPVLQQGKPTSYGEDDELAEKLWVYTEDALKEKGY